MGSTPAFDWPWPEYTDAADGSGVVQALALAMDATVAQLQDFVQAADARGRDMRFIQWKRAATQSLPNNATTPIVMDAAPDINQMGTAWTTKPEGWYLCSALVTFGGAATGGRQIVYRKNASTSNLPSTNFNTKPNGTFTIRTPNQDTGIYLLPSDALDIAAWHDGGTISTGTGDDACPRLLALYVYGPRPT